MTLIADVLLLAGAFGAAFYCMVLSHRLNRFNDLEKGVGGAVAVMSAQVDDMTASLKSAQTAAGESTGSLKELTERADAVAQRLELLVASMHDIPEALAEETPPAQEAVQDGESDVGAIMFHRRPMEEVTS